MLLAGVLKEGIQGAYGRRVDTWSPQPKMETLNLTPSLVRLDVFTWFGMQKVGGARLAQVVDGARTG